VAGVYKAVLPNPVRSGVSNFFSNLGEVATIVNDLLQFKFDKAMTDAGRLAINTTFGLGGILDVAGMDGIEKSKEDLGQTLATWGWKDSTYLVLPLLGSSTARDAIGLVADTWAHPLRYVDEPRVRNSLLGVDLIDVRAQYLPGSDLLDEAALDPYLFMRDAYLQRRDAQIMDGEGGAEADDSAEFDDGAVVAAAPK
jgi:phospholipid-binding lipoprotein MlaA